MATSSNHDFDSLKYCDETMIKNHVLIYLQNGRISWGDSQLEDHNPMKQTYCFEVFLTVMCFVLDLFRALFRGEVSYYVCKFFLPNFPKLPHPT